MRRLLHLEGTQVPTAHMLTKQETNHTRRRQSKGLTKYVRLQSFENFHHCQVAKKSLLILEKRFSKSRYCSILERNKIEVVGIKYTFRAVGIGRE